MSVLSGERPPSLEAYVLESRQAWATALNEMRRLPLDPSHNSEETWEWTISREFFTHIADRAAYVLESVLRDDVHDATYLYEAAMWFETLYRYDRNMTTANVKNMGLAHVHLVRSTKGKASPSVPDILVRGLLHDEQQPFESYIPKQQLRTGRRGRRLGSRSAGATSWGGPRPCRTPAWHDPSVRV